MQHSDRRRINWSGAGQVQMIIQVPFLDVSSGPTDLERSFVWKRRAWPLFQRRLTLHTCSWPCPIRPSPPRPPPLPQAGGVGCVTPLHLGLWIYQRTEWHHWCCKKPLHHLVGQKRMGKLPFPSLPQIYVHPIHQKIDGWDGMWCDAESVKKFSVGPCLLSQWGLFLFFIFYFEII